MSEFRSILTDSLIWWGFIILCVGTLWLYAGVFTPITSMEWIH